MSQLFNTILGVISATVIYIIQDAIKNKRNRKALISELEDKQNTEIDVVKEGIKAILHDRILQKCEYHIQKGYISMDDIQEIEYMNEPYKKLGGNGTAKVAIHKVHELPSEPKIKTGGQEL